MVTSLAQLEQAIEQTLLTLVREGKWQEEPGYLFPAERNTWLARPATRLASLGMARDFNGYWLERNKPGWQAGRLSDPLYLAVWGVNREITRRLARPLEGSRSENPYPIYHFAGLDILIGVQSQVEGRLAGLEENRQEALGFLKSSGPVPCSSAPLELRERFWEPLGVLVLLEGEYRALSRYRLWLAERAGVLNQYRRDQ